MNDIKRIKYLTQNTSTIIIILISCGFLTSLIYNYSYFKAMGSPRFLTLLNFSDYIESSLLFIVLIILALLYVQIIHVDIDGIIGRFKASRDFQNEIYKEIREIKNIIWRTFLRIIFSVFNIFITLLQLIGVTLPYLLCAILASAAYLKISTNPAINDIQFFKAITFIPFLFLLDIIIALRPKKYKIRLMVMKIFIIIWAISFNFGIYNAALDLTQNSGSKNIVFLRAVNKGAIFINIENYDLEFKPWSKIDLIVNNPQ